MENTDCVTNCVLLRGNDKIYETEYLKTVQYSVVRSSTVVLRIIDTASGT